MIKAFLFDYGGVMSTGGKGPELTQRLGAFLGVSPERAFKLLGLGWDNFMSGRIDEDGLWSRIEAGYGQPIAVEKRQIWSDFEFMKPDPRMVALVHELKGKGYKVGLLSNVVPPTGAVVHAGGGYDAFDFTILSYQTGYGKPELDIYHLALKELPGIKPEEVVFLDDQQRFLDPATSIGMQTVLVTDPEQAIADVHTLLEKQNA